MRKKLGHALVIPFDQYVKAKEDWQRQHPKATILEEVKNLSMGVMDVPHPTMIGHKTQQQVLMIMWAIVYEEEVTGEMPAMSNGKIIIGQA